MDAHERELLRKMVLIRRFEEKCAEVYQQQSIRGFLHLYIGEEAVAVGALAAIGDEDAVVTTYREHGHALARGISSASVMAEMYGRATGCARGRGGSMHLFAIERRFYGGYAIVGGGLPIAVGLALAERMRATRQVVACFFGDGATDEGEYQESLNLASLWRLPVLFLCENNLYAMGTALSRHTAARELCAPPHAYGIVSESVDGMDVLAVERATRAAIESIRETGAPRYLEFRTYRFRGHSMYDADRYRDKAEIDAWKKRDPIDRFVRDRAIAAEELAAIERDVDEEIAAATRAAEAAPFEDVADLALDVTARAS